MKDRVQHSSRRIQWCGTVLTVSVLLLWASPASAGKPQAVQITGIYLAAPDPGIPSSPGGKMHNIHLSGMSATIMMVSENPLLTGRLTWVGDANLDAEYNGAASGTGVFEVGTWNTTTTEFTASPSGAQWITKWESHGNLLGAYTVKVVGHGVSGDVEGMLFNIDAAGFGGIENYSGLLVNPAAE